MNEQICGTNLGMLNLCEVTFQNILPLKPSPKVQCFQCMKEVEMDKLRDHQEQEHPIATKRKVSIHDV